MRLIRRLGMTSVSRVSIQQALFAIRTTICLVHPWLNMLLKKPKTSGIFSDFTFSSTSDVSMTCQWPWQIDDSSNTCNMIFEGNLKRSWGRNSKKRNFRPKNGNTSQRGKGRGWRGDTNNKWKWKENLGAWESLPFLGCFQKESVTYLDVGKDHLEWITMKSNKTTIQRRHNKLSAHTRDHSDIFGNGKLL